MVAARTLMVVCAGIVLVLGTLHLVYTFSGPKLLPRASEVVASMQSVGLVISNETSVWRAWIGFNASHSFGAMLFGLVFGYLAVAEPAVLFGSAFLTVVGFAMLAGLVVLAKLYWFSVPLAGVTIALVGGFLAGLLLPGNGDYTTGINVTTIITAVIGAVIVVVVVGLIRGGSRTGRGAI